MKEKKIEGLSEATARATDGLLESLWAGLGQRIRADSRRLTDEAWQNVSVKVRKKLERALISDLLETGEEEGRRLTAWEVYERFRGRLLGLDPINTPEGPFLLRWSSSDLVELEKRMNTIRSYSERLRTGGLAQINDELPGLMAIMLRVSELCFSMKEKWKAVAGAVEQETGSPTIKPESADKRKRHSDKTSAE